MTQAPPRNRGWTILRALAATAVVAVIVAGTWYGFDLAASLPIKRVVITGDVQRIARSDLDAFVQAVEGAGPGGDSLAAVREAARRIPWVRDAAVRRRFPDAVEVTFQAHEPLARWDEGALVSTRGEVFNAQFDGALPRFKGPEGSAAAIAREYPALAAAIAPLGAAMVELRLSRRGAWQVVVDKAEGETLVLELGRGDIHARLARFVAAWPQVLANGVETRHADLRYASGFALTLSPALSQGRGGSR